MSTVVTKQAPQTVETKHKDGWETTKMVDDRVDDAGTKVHEETLEGRRENKEDQSAETIRARMRSTDGADYSVTEKFESYTYTKSG